MPKLELHIFTPEKLFFTEPVESVILTTTEGKIGVLPNHVPMVVALDDAIIKIKQNGEWKEAILIGGFAQIKNRQIVILADTAEWPADIEVARALEAKKRAEEKLLAHTSDIEYMKSQVALRRATARLKVKK